MKMEENLMETDFSFESEIEKLETVGKMGISEGTDYLPTGIIPTDRDWSIRAWWDVSNIPQEFKGGHWLIQLSIESLDWVSEEDEILQIEAQLDLLFDEHSYEYTKEFQKGSFPGAAYKITVSLGIIDSEGNQAPFHGTAERIIQMYPA
jgi:hypothetical protein